MDSELIAKRLHEIRVNAGGTPGREAAKAELDAELGTGLVNALVQLSTDVNHAKTILGERVQELAGELKHLHKAVTQAADGASEQTKSLVSWTKSYAVASFLLVVAMIGQLVMMWVKP